MIAWIGQQRPLPRLALIALLTAALAVVMQANFTLLGWLRDSTFLHWVYITAGARLAAIMVFGWPAVVSSALAFSVVHIFGGLGTVGWMAAMALGLAEAVGVWLAVDLFARLSGVRYPWASLNWFHIPLLALGTGGFGGFGLFSAKELIIGGENESFWRDVSLSTLGNVLGIAVFVAVMILLRKIYRRYIQNSVNKMK